MRREAIVPFDENMRSRSRTFVSSPIIELWDVFLVRAQETLKIVEKGRNNNETKMIHNAAYDTHPVTRPPAGRWWATHKSMKACHRDMGPLRSDESGVPGNCPDGWREGKAARRGGVKSAGKSSVVACRSAKIRAHGSIGGMPHR